MIGLKLTVVTQDSTFDVAVTPRIQVEFERHYKTGIAKAFGDELHMESIYWLAWKAATRQGCVPDMTFDAFLDALVDVEMGDDSAPDVPLAPPVSSPK
jgi:hypothetical protein